MFDPRSACGSFTGPGDRKSSIARFGYAPKLIVEGASPSRYPAAYSSPKFEQTGSTLRYFAVDDACQCL